MMRFTSSTFSVDAATDDGPKRTITGIALPYNTEAVVSGGQVVSFLARLTSYGRQSAKALHEP